jgi:hypothetical protein
MQRVRQYLGLNAKGSPPRDKKGYAPSPKSSGNPRVTAPKVYQRLSLTSGGPKDVADGPDDILKALLLPELVPTVINYLGAPFANRESTSVKALMSRGLTPIDWDQLKELPLGAVASIAPKWKRFSRAPGAERAVVWFSTVYGTSVSVNFRVVDGGKKKVLGFEDVSERYEDLNGKPAPDGYGFIFQLAFDSRWVDSEPMAQRVFASMEEGEVSRPFSRDDLLRLPAATHLIISKELDREGEKQHDGFFATFMSATEVGGATKVTFQTGESTRYWRDVVAGPVEMDRIDTPPWFGPDYPRSYELPPFWQFTIKLSENPLLVFRRDLSFRDSRPLLARERDNKSSGNSFTTSGSGPDLGSSSSSSSNSRKPSASQVTPRLDKQPDRQLRQIVNENTKLLTPILLMPKLADEPIRQVTFAGMGSLANSYWIEVEKDSGIKHLDRQDAADPGSSTELLLVEASAYGQEWPGHDPSSGLSSAASSLSSASSKTQDNKNSP